MAIEKPKIWMNVELRNNLPFVGFAAAFSNMRNPIYHQHFVDRQMRTTWAEHLPVTAR
jgi:hypothetical protein